MKREIKALRKQLWRDMTGCECKKVITVDGRTVTLRADEMCTPSWVRCNGRMNRITEDYKKHGLKVGPIAPGESGLDEGAQA